MPSEVNKKFASLSYYATDLHKKIDKINSIIGWYEENIAATNIGLEVWLDKSRLCEHIETLDEPTPVKETTYFQLGWGRSGSEWRILARQVKEEEWWPAGGELKHLRTVEPPMPLATTARSLRLYAVSCLEELLDALIDEAQTLSLDVGWEVHCHERVEETGK